MMFELHMSDQLPNYWSLFLSSNLLTVWKKKGFGLIEYWNQNCWAGNIIGSLRTTTLHRPPSDSSTDILQRELCLLVLTAGDQQTHLKLLHSIVQLRIQLCKNTDTK